MENQQTEDLKRITIAELWKNKNFTGISKLSFNVNNFPFLTMVNKNKATNLYFSKKAAEQIALNSFKEGEDLIANGFLADSEIVLTQNEKKENRYKISIPRLESNYSSNAAMNAVFGTTDNDFDVTEFMKEFKSSSDNVIKAPVNSTETA